MAPRRRASDQPSIEGLWTAMRESWILRLLVITVAINLISFILAATVLYPRARDNQHRIEALATQNQEASLSSCDRANETRPQTIRAYLAIAHGNRGRSKAAHQKVLAWQAVAEAFPPTAEVAALQVKVARDERKAAVAEANTLRRVSEHIANAQSAVAQYPDAKSLVRLSIIDCELAQGQVR